MNWDEYFINLCNVIKDKSKDESTQIGSIIVGSDNQIISSGYNSFPRGIDVSIKERQERPEKYYWFSHSDTNAIINCALNGVSTKGSRIYMSYGIPCPDCARNIINAGITEVICRKDQSVMNNPAKWEEMAKRSKEMFDEVGIKLRFYN